MGEGEDPIKIANEDNPFWDKGRSLDHIESSVSEENGRGISIELKIPFVNKEHWDDGPILARVEHLVHHEILWLKPRDCGFPEDFNFGRRLIQVNPEHNTRNEEGDDTEEELRMGLPPAEHVDGAHRNVQALNETAIGYPANLYLTGHIHQVLHHHLVPTKFPIIH